MEADSRDFITVLLIGNEWLAKVSLVISESGKLYSAVTKVNPIPHRYCRLFHYLYQVLSMVGSRKGIGPEFKQLLNLSIDNVKE
jgi:hypothetical protein